MLIFVSYMARHIESKPPWEIRFLTVAPSVRWTPCSSAKMTLSDQ
jgi:hypothetical protein